MYEIYFYKDKFGNQPIREYIQELKTKAETNKDARIHYDKITDYIRYLRQNGTRAGEPYTKHIEGDLWELRPLNNRIFFFCWHGNEIVLLHYFVKKTQKTPQREIDKAKRCMDKLKGDDKK